MKTVPIVSSMFTGYGRDPMNYALRYANEMKHPIEYFFLDDISAMDAFLANIEIVKDKETNYVNRRKSFDSAVFLFACFEEIQSEFEYCPKEVALADRFAKRNRKMLDTFDDGIDYDTPNKAGLYFIGETHFNPFTKEEFYWVKIGLSTNLSRRMKEYNTCCPMLWRIAFKTDCNRCLENEEGTYHEKLREIAVAICNHNEEWFMVDRRIYLTMCEKGFAYFD